MQAFMSARKGPFMFGTYAPHQRRNYLLSVFIAIGLLAGLTACGPLDANGATTLADTSARNLDVFWSLAETQDTGKIEIYALFLYQNTPVRLAAGEQVACNGLKLNFMPNIYLAYLPSIPPNHTISCAYSDAKGTTTTVQFTVPQQPTIAAPKEGATLTRTRTFSVTYTPQPVQQMQLSVATYTSLGKLMTGNGCGSSQITGSITCDATNTAPGKGIITLTAENSEIIANSGFHSANASAYARTTLNVTWT